jgi:hypothetical protein
MSSIVKGIGCCVGLGWLVTLTGCPNPNIYGTPRTTPAGKISHSVAVEAIGFKSDTTSGTFPTAPTYTFRIGATDNLDIGVRVGNSSTLGVDGKFNFLKSHSFDMAVAPGAQVFYFSASSSSGTSSTSSTVAGTYLHLPLLFGVNLGQSATIMPTAGIMYGIASGSSSTSDSSGNDSVKASSNTGIIGRFGLGVNLRVTDGFAMQPEFTLMKPFKDGASGYLYLAGLGFNFGALPSYAEAN